MKIITASNKTIRINPIIFRVFKELRITSNTGIKASAEDISICRRLFALPFLRRVDITRYIDELNNTYIATITANIPTSPTSLGLVKINRINNSKLDKISASIAHLLYFISLIIAFF